MLWYFSVSATGGCYMRRKVVIPRLNERGRIVISYNPSCVEMRPSTYGSRARPSYSFFYKGGRIANVPYDSPDCEYDVDDICGAFRGEDWPWKLVERFIARGKFFSPLVITQYLPIPRLG
jgi:hypothetical protein